MVLEQLDLSSVVATLERTGVYDVALPFLLAFTIIFAILQKINLFGSDKKNINVIIALVMAFFVIRVHEIVGILQLFLPKVTLAVIVLTLFLVIIGIFGTNPEGFKGAWLLGAVFFSIASIIWALSDTATTLPSWLQLTSADKAWLIGMAVFILIIYFITREPSDKVSGWDYFRKGLEDLDKSLGRKR